jgi:hypothetical protein
LEHLFVDFALEHRKSSTLNILKIPENTKSFCFVFPENAKCFRSIFPENVKSLTFLSKKYAEKNPFNRPENAVFDENLALYDGICRLAYLDLSKHL